LVAFRTGRGAHARRCPLAMLSARVLVGALGSLAAVGLLEAGRLVVAWLQVVVNGAGSYLLPRFAAAEKNPERGRPRTTRLAVALTGGTLACGGLCAVLAGPLGELITGDPVPRSEEHTSELQSRENLVCRLLLEKKKTLYGPKW